MRIKTTKKEEEFKNNNQLNEMIALSNQESLGAVEAKKKETALIKLTDFLEITADGVFLKQGTFKSKNFINNLKGFMLDDEGNVYFKSITAETYKHAFTKASVLTLQTIFNSLGFSQTKSYTVANLTQISETSPNGPKSPSTAADDSSTGTLAWTNPDNAKVSDSVAAQATAIIVNEKTHYLKVTNFGFNIPTDAIINGIKVEMRVTYGSSGANDNIISIIKNGNIGSINNAQNPGAWPGPDSYSYLTRGSATDIWGENWTAADINSSNFGVAISANVQTIGSVAYIDHVRITVYFTNNAITLASGSMAFASNGRKNGEGAGVGTGVLVFYDGSNWIACDTGQTVAA